MYAWNFYTYKCWVDWYIRILIKNIMIIQIKICIHAFAYTDIIIYYICIKFIQQAR